MSILSPHKSWDEASSGRSQEIADMSPSRTNIEFDNPTPTRRRTSARVSSTFDSVTTRKRESIIILDEVCVYSMCNLWWNL